MFDWLRGKQKKPKWIISLHQAAATSNERAAAWTVFAGTKSMVRDDGYVELHPEARGRHSPFDEELFARDAMAECWGMLTCRSPRNGWVPQFASGRPAGGILGRIRVDDLRQDGWLEPKNLKMPAFEVWLRDHGLTDHQPLTLSEISAG